jgi:hypothetical protein
MIAAADDIESVVGQLDDIFDWWRVERESEAFNPARGQGWQCLGDLRRYPAYTQAPNGLWHRDSRARVLASVSPDASLGDALEAFLARGHRAAIGTLEQQTTEEG